MSVFVWVNCVFCLLTSMLFLCFYFVTFRFFLLCICCVFCMNYFWHLFRHSPSQFFMFQLWCILHHFSYLFSIWPWSSFETSVFGMKLCAFYNDVNGKLNVQLLFSIILKLWYLHICVFNFDIINHIKALMCNSSQVTQIEHSCQFSLKHLYFAYGEIRGNLCEFYVGEAQLVTVQAWLYLRRI